MGLCSTLLSLSSKNKKIHSEKISYIFSKKAFLIFRKSTLKKVLIFLTFREMELPSSNDKKEIIFSQSKVFLIFWETEAPKKFLYFRKRNFFIFQETKTLKSFFYFRNFASSKIKRLIFKVFIIFQEMELCSSRKFNKTFQNFVTP